MRSCSILLVLTLNLLAQAACQPGGDASAEPVDAGTVANETPTVVQSTPPKRSPPDDGPRPVTVDHGVFDTLLRKHVRDERVDYRGVAASSASELKGYLDAMAAVDTDALSRDERLAYYLNLYNAAMIQAVLDRLRPGWTPAADDFTVFKTPLVRTGGKTISLNDLENSIIRPRFEDPRIHVALVCGARSCPPLLPRAYRAEDLDRSLDANMRRFVNDPSRNRIDRARQRLELSKIFEWYAADFGGPGGVARYVDRWTDSATAGFDVSFMEYSWALNDAK